MVHLEKVDAEVIYWDDIVGNAPLLVSLFFRWFGGFPPGHGEISVSFGQLETGFKRFLESRKLPYFSREEYAEFAGKTAAPVFEKSLQHLTGGDEARALVISGPGGIGKTRLSIEICEKARSRGWWPVKLERFARVDDLERLCASHAGPAKLLLFIDYAEAFAELDRLPGTILRLASDGAHRVSVLASTRSSSHQKVTDRTVDINLEELRLDARPDEIGYEAWVVRRILDHFRIPNAESVARSCGDLPVLAAFAAFLFGRDRAKFDEQFGNLVAVSDFSDWANGRLRLVEERFPQKTSIVQRRLAELATQLPMPEEEVDAFCATSDLNRELLDILGADHWLEPFAEGVAAAHDVLADAMLSRYLFGAPAIAQNRLKDLLAQALDSDRLDRCLTALDRLAGHSFFDNLSGRHAIEALLRHDGPKTIAEFPTFALSRLVTPQDLVGLLAKSDALRTRIAETPEAHLALARTAEWVATKGYDIVGRAEAEVALAGPLAGAVSSPRRGNIILRCAHAFDPESYQSAVLETLDAEPVHHDSHYLIVSLLKFGAPVELILSRPQEWLESNDKALKASFVYKSWLDAGGGVDAVSDHVLAWLGEHKKTPEAGFVYKSWLDAGGGVDAVSDHVLAWLGEHKKTPKAGFVYQSWLDAGGGVDAVSDHVLAWLGEHKKTPEAQFVYKSWLGAGGGVDAVSDHVLAWLGEHKKTPEAQFVYKSWLDAGGGVDAVSDHVLAWLGEHKKTPKAGFVYQSWLDAGGGVDAVSDHVLAWLGEYKKTPEAGFVYKSWLDAGGGVDTVSDQVLAWLGEHKKTPEAGFVYKSWLDAGGGVEELRSHVLAWLEVHSRQQNASFFYRSWLEAGHPFADIRTYCEAWLEVHWNTENAGFVTKILSKTDGLSPGSIARIVAWAGIHASHEDSIYRLSRMSRQFGRNPMTLAFRQLVEFSTEAVIKQLIIKSSLSENEKQAASLLFANLSERQFARDAYWGDFLILFSEAVKNGSILTSVGDIMSPNWALLLHDAIVEERLDPEKDRREIAGMLDIIRKDMPDQRFYEQVVCGYLGLSSFLESAEG